MKTETVAPVTDVAPPPLPKKLSPGRIRWARRRRALVRFWAQFRTNKMGLAGLVILFCLYTVIQQRELHRAVKALSREENDRADASVRLSELTALFQVSTTLQLQLRSERSAEKPHPPLSRAARGPAEPPVKPPSQCRP